MKDIPKEHKRFERFSKIFENDSSNPIWVVCPEDARYGAVYISAGLFSVNLNLKEVEEFINLLRLFSKGYINDFKMSLDDGADQGFIVLQDKKLYFEVNHGINLRHRYEHHVRSFNINPIRFHLEDIVKRLKDGEDRVEPVSAWDELVFEED